MCRGRKRCSGRRKAIVIKREDPPSLEDETLKAAMLLVYINNPKERPTICFMCLGNEGALVSVRVYSFSLLSDLSKHFKKKHLKKVEEGEHPECKLCRMSLDHKMHL